MNNVSIKQFKNAIDTMLNGYIDGVSYIPLSKTDDGKTIALVLGYELGYNDGEKWQVKVGTKTYTLCGKIAINIDDLQCDYDYDWYMPSNKDGDIYDTSMALSENHAEDLTWFLGEAEEMINLMNKGVLTI